MDTDSLALLVDVARRGSFAAVARSRKLDPSAVSRTVAGIEARLGVRLLHRSTRRMSLTDAGRAYVDRIAPLLEALADAAEAATDAATVPSGRVRLTASTAFAETWLAPRLADLLARYPGISIDLVATDTPVDLVEAGIDLALRHGQPRTADWIARRLLSVTYWICAAPDIPIPKEPLDFNGGSAIRLDLPGFRETWRLTDAAGRVTDIPVAGPILVSTPLTMRGLARAGIGPVLIADWLAAADVAAGRLVRWFPNHAAAPTTGETPAVWLMYPSRRFLPRKVRVVIEALTMKETRA